MQALGRRHSILVPLLVAVAVSGGSCPKIPPKESFMLAYIDRSPDAGHIRVRYSEDGLSWTLGDPHTALADRGVGAAASEDATGLQRILVHNGNVARFHFRMGIGPQIWDSSDQQVEPPPRPRGNPQVAYGSGPGWSGWLVTELGGQSGYVPIIYRYDATYRSLTDVSPGPESLSLGALYVLEAPSIVSRRGELVLAYLRHDGWGDNASVVDLQVLRGSVGAQGTVVWNPAFALSVPQPGYGPPVSWPALAYDNKEFLMGVLRRADADGVLHLFIYGSLDGASWSLVRRFDQVPASGDLNGPQVRFAGKSDGTTVVMFTNTIDGVARLYRYRNGFGWSEVAANSVFGGDMPASYPPALIVAGKPAPQP